MARSFLPSLLSFPSFSFFLFYFPPSLLSLPPQGRICFLRRIPFFPSPSYPYHHTILCHTAPAILYYTPHAQSTFLISNKWKVPSFPYPSAYSSYFPFQA